MVPDGTFLFHRALERALFRTVASMPSRVRLDPAGEIGDRYMIELDEVGNGSGASHEGAVANRVTDSVVCGLQDGVATWEKVDEEKLLGSWVVRTDKLLWSFSGR